MTRLLFFLASLALAVSSLAQTDIGAPAVPGAGEPFLFAAGDALLMSWLEPAGGVAAALRFSTYRAGRWSAPRMVVERHDLLVNGADFPSIVEDSNGVLFAHWLQTTGPESYDIRVTISKDGGRSWSAPLLLNRDGKKGEHGFVSLEPLPRGGVAAAWLEEGKLHYATVDAAGAMHSEAVLDGRTCECCTTGMAIADGTAVIVYRDRSAEEQRDIAAVRQTAGGWSKPSLVHADGWKIHGCPVNGPQIAARGRRAVAAWFTAAGDRPRVYAAFSEDGGAAFGTPVEISGVRPLGHVDVVMLENGSAVVTWLEQTVTGTELRAQLTNSGKRRGGPIRLAGTVAGRTFARAAAVGANVYVAWTDATKRIRVARVPF